MYKGNHLWRTSEQSPGSKRNDVNAEIFNSRVVPAKTQKVEDSSLLYTYRTIQADRWDSWLQSTVSTTKWKTFILVSKTAKLPRETSFVSLQSILPESNKIKEQPPVKRGDTSMMIENGNNGKVRKPRKLLFALRLQNITRAAGSGELPKQQLLSYLR